MCPQRERVSTDGHDVALHYRIGDGPSKVAPVVNVGPGGVAARLGEKLEPGTEVSLRLVLGEGKVISGHGRVVWSSSDESTGGLSFMGLDEYSRRLLQLWLSNLAQGNVREP
jgi:hypothetical protein